MMVVLVLGGAGVALSGLHKIAAPHTESSTEHDVAWFQRWSGEDDSSTEESIMQLKRHASWKPYIPLMFLGLAVLVLEIANIVHLAGARNAYEVAEHRHAWFNALRRIQRDGGQIKDRTLGKQTDPQREAQLNEVGAAAGIESLASSHREAQDLEAQGLSPNLIRDRGRRFTAYIVNGLICMLVALGVFGLASRGIFSPASFITSWTGLFGSTRGLIFYVPLLVFLLFTVHAFACGERPYRGICSRLPLHTGNAVAFGLLAVLGMVLPLIRSVQHANAPLQIDPLTGLQLDSRFDYDPRVTSDVAIRSILLFVSWILFLLVGMTWSGWGQGQGIASIFSDKSRLFTNCLLLIQHIYTFWHDYNRYSSMRLEGPNLPRSMFNTNMPGWASSFTTDIVVFVSDLMAIYPIVYDFLTWKLASRADPLKHVDFAIMIMVIVFVMFKLKTLTGLSTDKRANGVVFNQAAFAFS